MSLGAGKLRAASGDAGGWATQTLDVAVEPAKPIGTLRNRRKHRGDGATVRRCDGPLLEPQLHESYAR